MTLRLLQDGGEDVAGIGLVALSALDVQDGSLQHALEREGLFGFAVAALQLLDGLVQVRVERPAERRQIDIARAENTFPVLIASA